MRLQTAFVPYHTVATPFTFFFLEGSVSGSSGASSLPGAHWTDEKILLFDGQLFYFLFFQKTHSTVIIKDFLVVHMHVLLTLKVDKCVDISFVNLTYTKPRFNLFFFSEPPSKLLWMWGSDRLDKAVDYVDGGWAAAMPSLLKTIKKGHARGEEIPPGIFSP